MRLFGFEIKASRASSSNGLGMAVSYGSVTSTGMTSTGSELGMGRGIQAYYEMARMSSDIQACIRELQQTAGKGGWYLAKKFATGAREIPRTDADLMYYAFDKGSGGFDELKRDIIYNLTVSGNAFILKRRNDQGKVVGYECRATHYVAILKDGTNGTQVVGYKIGSPHNASTTRYSPDDVLHLGVTKNTDDGFFYLSPLEPVRYDVLGDYQANRMNYEWFFTSGVPPALYKFSNGTTRDEMQGIIDGVRNHLKGGENKNRAIGVQGLDEIVQLSQDADMQNIERRRYATEKICAILGVPRIQLGYTDGINYSNANQQYTKFIENTIRPLEKFLKEAFDMLIRADFGETKIEFMINDDHIDDIEQKSRIAQTNVAQGIWTPNEAREYIGFDSIPDELGDVLFIPNGRVPIDQLPAEATPAEITEPV